jgi:hypothetical protein
MSAISPYDSQPIANWKAITKGLIRAHPLSIEEIISVVHIAWEGVWSTQIGSEQTRLSLLEINPPATVIGYFFEKLMGKELSVRYPDQWIDGSAGNHKDLHNIINSKFSIEVKSSGQLGLKIFGNRSYGQEVENTDRAKKDKSGYYITVNFYKTYLTLIRFGWIDGSDWVAQTSATGQAAGLRSEVYEHKLISIAGDYTLNAPIQLLDGVGPGLAMQCQLLGLNSIRDILTKPELAEGKLNKVLSIAQQYYEKHGPRTN